MLSKKSKLLLVCCLTILLGCLGAGVWRLLQAPARPQVNQADLVRPASGKDAPVPGAMTPKGKGEKRPSGSAVVQAADGRSMATPFGAQPAEPEKRSEQPVEVPWSVPVSGTLARLTGLRAQLQELDAQVLVAEKEAKLNKLHADPVVVATPAPTSPPLQLPALGTAQEHKSGASEREARVVSVQGVNGELTAMIRTSSGTLVTVRQGGRFAGGVAEISRNGVLVRTAGSVRNLAFE